MKPSVILTSSLRVLTAATAVGLAVDLASAQLVTSRRALEGRNQDDFRQNSIIPRQGGGGGGGGNGGGNNNGNGNNDQETVVVEATRVVTVRPGGNRPSATSSNTASPAKPSTTNNKDGEKSSSSQSGAATSSPQTTGPTPSPSESDSSPSPSESAPAVESSSPEPSEDDKDDDDRKEGGISAGTAAGIAAGAVAGLALIGLVAFVLWRRRRGPIRGAVVTADYPFGDGVGMMAAEKNLDGHPGDGNNDGQVPRLPDIRGLEASTRGPEYEYGFGTAAGMGAGGMDRAREGEDELPAFPADKEEVEYMDVPVGIGKEIGGIGAGAGYEYSPQQLQQQQFAPAAGVAGRYGFTSPRQQQDIPQMPQQQMAAIIPPAGMMPGAYFSPPPAQQQQQQQQQQVVPQPGGFQAYSSPPPHHPGGQAAYTSPPQQQPEGQAGYASPPQRKLTAEGMPVGMAMSTGEYHSYKPPQQAQRPPPQPVSPLEERRRGSGARTASAYMQGYPSPGNPPILPVSPLSTYYPDRQSSGPVQPLIISPYYPGANGPAEPNSPGDLPQYMIPGGSRSRAMSYSSQYAPAALDMNDGTPAPPVPSMPVMDSDGEPPLSPLRRNPIYEHF